MLFFYQDNNYGNNYVIIRLNGAAIKETRGDYERPEKRTDVDVPIIQPAKNND